MPAFLSIDNLVHTYPNGVTALRGVSLEVEHGEFLAVVGLSGSGKSTLLRSINRLIEPTSGSITINGMDVAHLRGALLREHRARIGMIFQQFNLIDRHTVLDNVLYGALGSTPTVASVMKRFTQQQHDAALQALEIVGIAEKATERVDTLSGGQQQRVAIARALVQRPALLLADEPVASLDPSTSHIVMQYLERINSEMGMTVICTLHSISLVRRYASRVIALRSGEVVFAGRPDRITDEGFRAIYGEEAVDLEMR